MATITFDTLKFVETLKAHGLPEEQAKGIAEAFRDATGEAELATKRDLKEARLEIDTKFERAFGELTLIKWMLGILLGGVVALVLKAFFPS
ncbi:hypothetical protein SAMN02949497_3541 [Methylomagnum ishizawai]|uniref:DUF1640 domain-containing protein n=1 Tax=Methylomagnum ishizawai TaxID=1760988 RepID=A0A1Y6D0N8_9GAMM|nr:hypothetical protein [Methylomagnum ishizawai]SMF96156.1 hypothetical protein SAMN02949497_3541 [Methylomagnum ishizawai]